MDRNEVNLISDERSINHSYRAREISGGKDLAGSWVMEDIESSQFNPLRPVARLLLFGLYVELSINNNQQRYEEW